MEPRRRPVLRRLLAGGLAVLAVLAAADTALWMMATARLEDELAAWQARRREAGWTLSAGQPVRTGWPLAAALSLPDPLLAGGGTDLPGGLSWRAGRAELAVALLRPDHLRLVVSGRAAAAPVHPAGTRLHRRPVRGDHPAGAGPTDSLPLDLSAAGLRIAASTGQLTIAALAVHADAWPEAPQGRAALAVTLQAGTVELPPLRHNLPGRSARTSPRRRSTPRSTGPWPATGDVTARATAWRDGGGKLEAPRLALVWGPLGLSASATAALDEQLQPTGAATARAVGYGAVLDALARAGVLGPRVAQAIIGVLGLLARPAPDGGAPQIEVPVTVQNRTLSLGPFPLVRLREWIWP